jgi:hypothetical protein
VGVFFSCFLSFLPFLFSRPFLYSLYAQGAYIFYKISLLIKKIIKIYQKSSGVIKRFFFVGKIKFH